MTTRPTAASVAAHRAATDDTAYATRVSDAVKAHGAGETEVRALDG